MNERYYWSSFEQIPVNRALAWNKVSKKTHAWAITLVSFATNLSALWIFWPTAGFRTRWAPVRSEDMAAYKGY